MHGWRTAALVFATAFVIGLVGLILGTAIPALYDPSRMLVVGAGSLLAGVLVIGLWTALLRQVELDRRDTRPLVTMHPRRR